MSISFCKYCDQIVEGHTFEQRVDGVMTNTCEWCGKEVIELQNESENSVDNDQYSTTPTENS